MRRRFPIHILAVLIPALALPSPAGAVGCPSTVSISESANRERIGDSAGTEQRLAQKFAAPCTGSITQFQLSFRTTIGTPSGSFHWAIAGDSLGVPGANLTSGDITPTASAVNTISFTGVTLNEGASYWIVMWADNQSNDNSWGINQGTASGYTGGNCFRSTNGGSTWSDTSGDCWLLLTVGAVTATNTPTTAADTPTPANTSTPTITPSPTPDIGIVVTSSAGNAMRFERTATYGDLASFGGLLIVAAVGFFILAYNFLKERPRA